MGRTLFNTANISSRSNMNTDDDNSHGKSSKNNKNTTNDYFFGGNDGNQEEDGDDNKINNDDDDDTREMDCGIDKFGNRMEDAMVDELFQSHFERGECGDLPTLKKCARSVLYQIAAIENARSSPPPPPPAAAALPPATPTPGANHSPRLIDEEAIEQEMVRIEQFLDSDEGLEEVVEEIRVAKHDMGIQGVPSIIVQNTYLLSGGQDSHTFVEIFKRVV